MRINCTGVIVGFGVGLACIADAGIAGAYTCETDNGCSCTVTANYATVTSGYSNSVDSDYSLISGGRGNTIDANSTYSAIVGGYSNLIEGYTAYSFIGGGSNNVIVGGSSEGSLDYNVICGGGQNAMNYGSYYNFIGGGLGNSTSQEYATVCGGYDNQGNGLLSTVSGGSGNLASGTYGTVAGGNGNVASGETAFAVGNYSTASGNFSVAIGAANTAGALGTLALGTYADADQSGCFAWSDASATSNRTCLIQTSPTNATQISAPNGFIAWATGGAQIITAATGGTPTAGVFVNSGSGTWTSISDRNVKQDFRDVDPYNVLRRVAAMPITTWRYKTEVTGATHMGPMAQDFYAAFGLGDDERHLTNLDEDGVAFAAIQGLYAEVLDRDETIDALRNHAVALEKANVEANQRVASLEKRLNAIEAKLGLKD